MSFEAPAEESCQLTRRRLPSRLLRRLISHPSLMQLSITAVVIISIHFCYQSANAAETGHHLDVVSVIALLCVVRCRSLRL